MVAVIKPSEIVDLGRKFFQPSALKILEGAAFSSKDRGRLALGKPALHAPIEKERWGGDANPHGESPFMSAS